jgi:hypothetical protein
MQMLPRGPWDFQWGHTSGCCQKSLGRWWAGLIGRWLIGWVRIVARTLVDVTLLYVEGQERRGSHNASRTGPNGKLVRDGLMLQDSTTAQHAKTVPQGTT